MTAAALVTVQPAFTDAGRIVLAGFLGGYRGLPRGACTVDLRQFAGWCRARSVPLFPGRRAGIETFARELEARAGPRATVTGGCAPSPGSAGTPSGRTARPLASCQCGSGSPRPGCTTGWQMSQYPGFGILLACLLDRRGLGARSLPGAESEKGELRAVLGGAVPSPSLLRWLTTALEMHVPGLYFIAGMEVPPDLAPPDVKAGPQTARLAWKAGQLPGRHQGELPGFARSCRSKAALPPSRRRGNTSSTRQDSAAC